MFNTNVLFCLIVLIGGGTTAPSIICVSGPGKTGNGEKKSIHVEFTSMVGQPGYLHCI